MTLKDTQCQGGCGKVRSILCSDSPADWLCNDCRTKKIPAFVETRDSKGNLPFTIVTTVKVKGKAPIEYTRIVYAKTAMEALLQKEIKQSL